MKNRKNNKPTEPQRTEPLHEQIELRAYYIWLASGGGHGNDLQHWLQAEEDVRPHASTSIAGPKNPAS